MIAFVLLLQTLHLPLPCPDLDGECRGKPIVSLLDANAWHILLLGVRPSDDIDRGPFKTDDPGEDRSASQSPFGDEGMVRAAGTTDCDQVIRSELLAETRMLLRSILTISYTESHFLNADIHCRLPSARTLRTLTCVWVI